jgi:hypothetical protein
MQRPLKCLFPAVAFDTAPRRCIGRRFHWRGLFTMVSVARPMPIAQNQNSGVLAWCSSLLKESFALLRPTLGTKWVSETCDERESEENLTRQRRGSRVAP